jgi:hypothetical protein
LFCRKLQSLSDNINKLTACKVSRNKVFLLINILYITLLCSIKLMIVLQ